MGDIVNSTRASVTLEETRGSVRSPKWKACSQANFPISESFQIFHLKFIKNHISTNEFRELRIVFQMFFGRFEKLTPGSVIKGITIPVPEIPFLSICRLIQIRAMKDTDVGHE